MALTVLWVGDFDIQAESVLCRSVRRVRRAVHRQQPLPGGGKYEIIYFFLPYLLYILFYYTVLLYNTVCTVLL